MTTLGVLCFDTTFTKIPGHIRNPATFGFPVDYEIVRDVTPEQVVFRADPNALLPFADAARRLEARGVAAIAGACGFLVIYQRELAAAVNVPLFSSSLLQLPLVHRMLRPEQGVGLLVASEGSLTPRHLAAIGAEDVPIRVADMAGCAEFREVILEGRRDDLDVGLLEREVLDQVDELAKDDPDLGALVIECTDLAPFAHVIQDRLGVPVFDIVTLAETVHRALTRSPFS